MLCLHAMTGGAQVGGYPPAMLAFHPLNHGLPLRGGEGR